MPFIGNKPSAIPLTSADITDGIITSAKITDGTIANADISSTAGITLNKLSGNPNFRNIVINGDMQIAQRSTSVASITTAGYYTLDRWNIELSSLGTFTMSQDTDVPTGYGFRKSLKLDCTTADASPSASDKLLIKQIFEGQNLQYLKKGTVNAVSLTLSFWVKSTKTGTYTINLYDVDNNRQISKTYTVSASNTWEQKTVTFAGDTTGAFDNDNAGSIELTWCLGTGTNFTSGTLATSWESYTAVNRFSSSNVNIADSTSNDFWITGVQLEAGTSATDFEFLPVDVSLQRCQRYYEKSYFYTTAPGTATEDGSEETNGFVNSSKQIRLTSRFKTRKRATPTITFYDSAGNSGRVSEFNDGALTSNVIPGGVVAQTDSSFIIYRSSTSATGFSYHYEANGEL